MNATPPDTSGLQATPGVMGFFGSVGGPHGGELIIGVAGLLCFALGCWLLYRSKK